MKLCQGQFRRGKASPLRGQPGPGTGSHSTQHIRGQGAFGGCSWSMIQFQVILQGARVGLGDPYGSLLIGFCGIILWPAASEVGQQFSIRTVFPATFCWKMPIPWYQDALWEHISAIKANSTSQTSAWPPCLLPSWLSLWDSWAPALQPAAHLIFLYSIVVLFILHFFPTFSSL